jgi:hypothetical protein
MIFHNPENLTPYQLDPNNEGWRLLTVEELDNPPGDAQYWAGAEKVLQWSPNQERAKIKSRAITYRTKAPLLNVLCGERSESRENGMEVVEPMKDCTPSMEEMRKTILGYRMERAAE